MASISESDINETYVPARKVRTRYGDISDTSLRRREKNEPGFPKSYVMNGRRYWKLSELVVYERRLVAGR